MAAADPGFWAGKRVLVTGHTGFKGAWLTLWLARLGADITGYALAPPTEPSLFAAARVGEVVNSVLGDIRDLPHLTQVVARARPDILFHLAAQPLVRHSYAEPVKTMAVNVMGTVNLLEAVRQAGGVKAVICVTSDKCYAPQTGGPGYREESAMGGHDPYSASKGCAELVIAAYRDAFLAQAGTALASVRAGNVIGGGDWAADRLIPDILRAISAGRRPLIRAPEAVRPWQHVLDALSGYLVLAERLWTQGAAYAGAWNFGPDADECRPVAWITERLCALWGGAGWDRDVGSQPHEAAWLMLDSAKAKRCLGWQAVWRLDEALAEIVAFHRAMEQGGDLRAVALGHLHQFESGSR